MVEALPNNACAYLAGLDLLVQSEWINNLPIGCLKSGPLVDYMN